MLGFELDAVTVVFLGGVTFLGGFGRMSGVLWALACRDALRSMLQLPERRRVRTIRRHRAAAITSLLAANVSRCPAPQQMAPVPPPFTATTNPPQNTKEPPEGEAPNEQDQPDSHSTSRLRTLCAGARRSSASCADDDAGGAAGAGGEERCTDGQITIGVIPKLGDDPYMTTVRDAMVEAAEATGDKRRDRLHLTQRGDRLGPDPLRATADLQDVDVIAISGSDLEGCGGRAQEGPGARHQGA